MTSEYSDFHFTSSDGLRLYGRKYGWEHLDPEPIVCLPGLTRTTEDFDALARYLSSPAGGKRRVLSLDYRGRGKSEHDRDWENYNIITEAGDAISGMIAAGLEHVNLLGTSRGGLIAMAMTAIRPGILKSVILNDIGPELDGPGIVRIKRSLENAGKPRTLEQAGAALYRANRSFFPNLTEQDWNEQAALIYTERRGKLVTRYDPKLMNTLKGLNIDVPLADMWPQFKGLVSVPVMLVYGMLSDLISQEIVEKMVRAHPRMRVHPVPDEGHAPLLKDRKTQTAIADFVNSNRD